MSMICALVSIFSMMFRTLPQWQVATLVIRSVKPANNATLFPPQVELVSMQESEAFEIIDTVCNVLFTLEFLIRLACCPRLSSFVSSSVNIIDFVALISFYADLAFWVLGTSVNNKHNMAFITEKQTEINLFSDCDVFYVGEISLKRRATSR